MIRFVAYLANGLAIIFWSYTYRQAKEHARNLASFHHSTLTELVEH